jgi:ATP-dependent DNA ligase
VVEVLSAELTVSPNHTAGWGQLKEDAGLSMRFPRFTGRWRNDKEPQDANTTHSWPSFTAPPARHPPISHQAPAASSLKMIFT